MNWKKNCVTSHIFTRYDDHVVMPRQMTNEIHKPEFRECSCNWLGTICEITFQRINKKDYVWEFPIKQYLNIEDENFSSTFEELSQKQFRKTTVFSAWKNV